MSPTDTSRYWSQLVVLLREDMGPLGGDRVQVGETGGAFEAVGASGPYAFFIFWFTMM